jgi:hypothetical protein
MELLGDMGHVESHFGPFGDGVRVVVHILHETYQLAQKLFCRHPMVLLGDEAQMEAHLGLYGDSANLKIR